MSGLPVLTGSRLVRAREQAGFRVVRSRGSHRFLRHVDGRRTVVPVHRGETIGRGLLARILRDCDLSQEDLLRFI